MTDMEGVFPGFEKIARKAEADKTWKQLQEEKSE